jgi:hypothetical protein
MIAGHLLLTLLGRQGSLELSVFILKSFSKNPEKGGWPAKFDNLMAHIIFMLILYLNNMEILGAFRNLNPHNT